MTGHALVRRAARLIFGPMTGTFRVPQSFTAKDFELSSPVVPKLEPTHIPGVVKWSLCTVQKPVGFSFHWDDNMAHDGYQCAEIVVSRRRRVTPTDGGSRRALCPTASQAVLSGTDYGRRD